MDNSFLQGANLYLQMRGLKRQEERDVWLQKLQGDQFGLQQQQFGLQQQQAQSQEATNELQKKRLEWQMEQDRRGQVQMESYQKGVKDIFTPKFREIQQRTLEEGGIFPSPVETQQIQVSPMEQARQLMQLGAEHGQPKEAYTYAKEIFGETKPTAWHPTTKEEAIEFETAKSGLKKPPYISMGNAAELAMNEKYPGWQSDPTKSNLANMWLGTVEGKQKVQEWTQRTTAPSYTFPVTDKGIIPAITRGPGAGTIGQPTGYGKPLTDTQLSKVGELNAVLSNIGKVKELYGYGMQTEHEEWVGPIAGRKGGLEAKYLGTASTEQVKFYSYVKDMQDALLRARSGAQINEQEYKRLVAFLPDPTLPPLTFKAKLDRFEEATKIVMEEKLSAFEKGGYGVGGLKQTEKIDFRKKYNY